MNLYNVGAFLKIIVGMIILAILYHYVNVYQDPAVGLSFGFLGVFMIVWGLSYYLFLAGYKLFSQYPTHLQTSLSYKLSLLLGMYTMVNLSLVITDHRTKFIGIVILIVFIILQVIFANNSKKQMV